KEVLNEAMPEELDEVISNLHTVRKKLNGNFEQKVKKLNALTKVLVEEDNGNNEKRWRKIATYSLLAFGLMLIGHFIFSYVPLDALRLSAIEIWSTIDSSFLVMLAAGFFAQLVDGALGMGYGVTSATIL